MIIQLKKFWSNKGFLLAVVVGLMLACGPINLAEDILGNAEATASAVDGYDWYISTDGSDTYACNTPLRACKTLEGAIEKASDGDSIYIAAGTYTEPRTPGTAVNINRSLTIQGAGEDLTILDFTEFQGIFVNSEVEISMTDLKIQNVKQDDAVPFSGVCIQLNTPAKSLTLQNVTVQQCDLMGIYSDSREIEISLKKVTILENGSDGIYQLGGNLAIDKSLVKSNGNHGATLNNVNLNLTDSTIDENGEKGLTIQNSVVEIAGTTFTNNGGGLEAITRVGVHIGLRAGLDVTQSQVSVTDCVFIRNVVGIASGGSSSRLVVSDTTFEGQYKIGLQVHSGMADVNNVTLQHNGSSDPGIMEDKAGGISIYLGTVALNNSLLTDNYGGIHVWGTSYGDRGGTITISSTTISNNHGPYIGGIANYGNASIEYSTIDNNQADNPVEDILPSGILNSNQMSIINSTISNNIGAGIVDWRRRPDGIGGLIFKFVTIAENKGPGIAFLDDNPAVVLNSLVGLNGEGDCLFGGSARGTRYDTNMDTDGSCGGLSSTVEALRLDPLADNGGPTQTRALLEGSPAIDAAAGCPASGDDQRSFPRGMGAPCDIGAYEANQIESDSSEALESYTPTPEPPQVTAIKNANCREGPSTAYEVEDTLFEGQSAQVLGRNEDNTWWQIQGPAFGKLCWVSNITVDVDGDVEGIPIGTAPPLPEAPSEEQPEEPPAAPQGCFTYDQYQNVVCTVPCPPNPQPGGSCTP